MPLSWEGRAHVSADAIAIVLAIMHRGDIGNILTPIGGKVLYVGIVHMGGTPKSSFFDDGPSLCTYVFFLPRPNDMVVFLVPVLYGLVIDRTQSGLLPYDMYPLCIHFNTRQIIILLHK